MITETNIQLNINEENLIRSQDKTESTKSVEDLYSISPSVQNDWFGDFIVGLGTGAVSTGLGAIIGGPVGAVIGTVAGAAIGATISSSSQGSTTNVVPTNPNHYWAMVTGAEVPKSECSSYGAWSSC